MRKNQEFFVFILYLCIMYLLSFFVYLSWCICVCVFLWYLCILFVFTLNWVFVWFDLCVAIKNCTFPGDVPHLLVDFSRTCGDALQAHHLSVVLQRHRVQRLPRLPLVQVGTERGL